MVKRNQGLDTPCVQTIQHGAIPVQGSVIEHPRFRLDTTPFHTHAVGVHMQLRHQVKIDLGVAPPVTGQPAPLPMPDGARLLLKFPPLIIDVVTFHLVG